MKKVLHLHLKFEYFDKIEAGRKPKEYRLAEKWKHKLDNGKYTDIRLYRGYQEVSPSTIIDLPYKGYELETITHKHFGENPVAVCSIDVRHQSEPKKLDEKRACLDCQKIFTPPPYECMANTRICEPCAQYA